MKYVFINHESIVVNVISGMLSEYETARLLKDYGVLFGAKTFVVVEPEVSVWSGGTYDAASGTFAPPPKPIVEAVVEPTMEGTTDGIPVLE